MRTKLLSLMFAASVSFASAQVLISEAFDDITTLTTWTTTNQSAPTGTSAWFQGNPLVFSAQSGATDSYIGANFNNTSGAGTISNWLITPNVMVQDGDKLEFYTRTVTGANFADRLEVRSSSGATFTAPSGATGLGSFTTLHLTINPNLLTGAANYPDTWTKFTITVSGIGTTPVARNFAFRYFVTNGGPAGDNSNFIGIDTFSITRPAMAVSNVNKVKVGIYPNPATDYLTVKSDTKVSAVELYDIAGKKLKVELVDGRIDVRSLSKGSYLLKVTNAEGTATQKFLKN